MAQTKRGRTTQTLHRGLIWNIWLCQRKSDKHFFLVSGLKIKLMGGEQEERE